MLLFRLPFFGLLQVSALECFHSLLQGPLLPFPSLVSVYVRCVHADTVGDSVACLLPDPFNSRYGSYIKIICGKQILTFIINWEGNTRLNSNQVVGKRAASYWEDTSLMLKQNLSMGPRQTQRFWISSHKDPMKLLGTVSTAFSL